MWCVDAEITRSFLGSNTTMSASDPGAIVLFRGYRPNIFAGAVATSFRCHVSAANASSRTQGGTSSPSRSPIVAVEIQAADPTVPT
jgi:hypothetical protein